MYKFTFFTICIQFWNNFSHFFSTKKISFELCKILRASLLKMRSHCIFYMHEDMLDNGRILHLICRTKQRKVVRDDENSRDLVSMTASLRNPTSWGRQPSDTYKSYDYASRDTAHGPAVDSKKMRLDWSRWYIAVHFRVFPHSREPGANFLCDRKKIYIRCVCSYIYLYRTEHT